MQILVRLAFSIPINKAQGQMMKHCDIILKEPYFSQDQLYVTCSTVRNSKNLYIYSPNNKLLIISKYSNKMC